MEECKPLTRGFYFKNAQLLSTRDDFLPAQYLHWMKETQAGSQPHSFTVELNLSNSRTHSGLSWVTRWTEELKLN